MGGAESRFPLIGECLGAEIQTDLQCSLYFAAMTVGIHRECFREALGLPSVSEARSESK